MYVKVYGREYANALDSMLLSQFKDVANLYIARRHTEYVAGTPGNSRHLEDLGARTIDAVWDRGLDK